METAWKNVRREKKRHNKGNRRAGLSITDRESETRV